MRLVQVRVAAARGASRRAGAAIGAARLVIDNHR